MNKEWQKKKEEWYNAEITRRKNEVIDVINSCEFINDDERKELISEFDKWLKDASFSFYSKIGSFCLNHKNEIDKVTKWLTKIYNLDIRSLDTMIEHKAYYTGLYYLDSEPMEFDGDIIITDPCYIINDDTAEEDHWELCNYGNEMENLGIHNYMTRNTLYGDWSCTTYSDTGDVLGHFCADAGLVSVFLLDEVLKYNPKFDSHIKSDWTTTWIKDFKGTVQFVVVYTDGYYEEDSEYHEKGEHWEDYSVQVVGKGINKITGEPINFVGKQTGF